MKRSINFRDIKSILFSDKEDFPLFQYGMTVEIPAKCVEDTVLIIDMDSDYQRIKDDVAKSNSPNIICISSSWNIEKLLFALELGCKAFLETFDLDSLGNTIELIHKSGICVLDEKVSLLINVIFSIKKSGD